MNAGALAFLGLNLLNAGAKYGMGAKAQKLQRKLGKAQQRHELNQANRFLAQTRDDAGRGRRQLEESIFARGLGDSSIREGDLAFYDRSSQRQLEGAQERAALAGKGMSAFKKQLKQQRLAQYLDLGVGIGNAGLGAWQMGAFAPQPIPQYQFPTLGAVGL